MKQFIIFLMILFSMTTNAQKVVHSKLELGYDYVEFYSDTIYLGTIKTHSNIDLFDNGYFLTISSGSDRIYHFIIPNSSAYDINRLTFKQTNIDYIYGCEFKLFGDSIAVYIDDKTTRIINKNYKQLIFHN